MRWLLYSFFAILVAAFVAVATAATMVVLAWPKLPALDSLTDYRPKVPLRVYTADGHLIGEFGEERRALVNLDQVPVQLRQAILAAEDERFYEHPGIDIKGLGRAALANFASGEREQGASTITMQVARNFYLSREKTYNRKFYEVLLALKIEHELSKDRILELYINQIFLGQRAYGFASAARIYFGKQIEELNLAESAMLAGLPKAPSIFNPIANFRRAQIRQHYVLRRMVDAGFIDQAAHDEAIATPLVIASARAATTQDGAPAMQLHAEYVAEMARLMTVEQFGEQAHQGGFRVITTIRMDDQINAYHALRDGLENFDRRRGYRGPEDFADLSVSGSEPENLDELLSEYRDYDDMLVAIVTAASTRKVTVYRHGQSIDISGRGLSFVAPMLAERAPQKRRIRVGAIVRVRDKGERGWEITQLPEIEGAFVAMDANTGAVRALVGGYDFDRSKFNNVTQAVRQPGSVFKPFIYSAALEKGFSPGQFIDDAPLHFPAGVTGGKPWSPKNYDGRYSGPISIRNALVRSKNMVSIRLLQAVTPQFAQEYIARFGFDPNLHPPYLPMALGAGGATPWQMAGAYGVFANGGYRVEPYIVSEIIDGNGNTVARTNVVTAGTDAPQVLDPRNAWLMDSMMRDVVRRGTANRAAALNRNDLAGKTGTTNDYVDAWFAGYSPDLVGISWVGYRQPRNLGSGETGGRVALPIWIDYMRDALKGTGEKEHKVPDGLIRANNDYYYKENKPPEPPPPTTVAPELRYFIEDGMVPPPSNDAPFGGSQVAPPPPPPRAPEAPAPVEDRVIIRR